MSTDAKRMSPEEFVATGEVPYGALLDLYATAIAERFESGKISEERLGDCLAKLDEWEDEYWRKVLIITEREDE